MYHVSFPELGINLDINNKIEIGGLSIYWYGIIIATGLIIAVIYGSLNSKRLGISADKLLNCVIVGVITGIIGARLYYVIFNWDYYGANPIKILAINEGGLAIYGGIIGALIGGLIVAKISKMNVPALLDVAAIGFLIGQGIGRWGNFFNQEAYGTATSLPWGMVSEGTNNIIVHPCFLYESLWCLLGVLVLHIFSHTKLRKYHGQIALIYLVWYGTERAVVEGLRTDSLYIPNTEIRVSQAFSILIAIVGLISLIVLYIKKYENLKLYTDSIKTVSQENITTSPISEEVTKESGEIKEVNSQTKDVESEKVSVSEKNNNKDSDDNFFDINNIKTADNFENSKTEKEGEK
ncbi:MAG: prolipoprotein diacylglyceryl transferase [Acutalibacteraceae bacterium]|nr:prolipoprotein diacylglyceryl transferase [Acutalibacteraceae bacterium]